MCKTHVPDQPPGACEVGGGSQKSHIVHDAQGWPGHL